MEPASGSPRDTNVLRNAEENRPPLPASKPALSTAGKVGLLSAGIFAGVAFTLLFPPSILVTLPVMSFSAVKLGKVVQEYNAQRKQDKTQTEPEISEPISADNSDLAERLMSGGTGLASPDLTKVYFEMPAPTDSVPGFSDLPPEDNQQQMAPAASAVSPPINLAVENLPVSLENGREALQSISKESTGLIQHQSPRLLIRETQNKDLKRTGFREVNLEDKNVKVFSMKVNNKDGSSSHVFIPLTEKLKNVLISTDPLRYLEAESAAKVTQDKESNNPNPVYVALQAIVEESGSSGDKIEAILDKLLGHTESMETSVSLDDLTSAASSSGGVLGAGSYVEAASDAARAAMPIFKTDDQQ